MSANNDFPSFQEFADAVGVKAPEDFIPICTPCLEGDHSTPHTEHGCENFTDDVLPGRESVIWFCRCRVSV